MTNTEFNSKYFEKVDDEGEELAFKQEDQLYILFSLSHKEFAPVPQHIDSPGLRFYGAFPDQESLHEHIKIVKQYDSDCSILVNETHEWVVGASSPAHLVDAEYISSKKIAVLKSYKDKMAKNREEFEENVSHKSTGRNAKKSQEDKSFPIELKDKKKVGRKISRNVQMNDQKLVAISVIPDPSKDCEFLFKVYGFFENEEQANRWVRNVGGVQVTEFDIDIVSTCEWMYPQSMTSLNVKKEFYRAPELDKIMKNYKSKPDDVRRLEDINKSNSDNVQRLEDVNKSNPDTVNRLKEENKTNLEDVRFEELNESENS